MLKLSRRIRRLRGVGWRNIMAKINMDLIKKLRDKTQVGMMDCKKALIEADGDFEKAVEILRKKGAKVAAKRAGNITENGTIASYISDDNKLGVLVEVGCETDFAANTEDMRNFALTVAKILAETECGCGVDLERECVLNQKLESRDMTIHDLFEELTAKISEKIDISRCAKFYTDNGLINAYVHAGNTVGAMVELMVSNLNDNNIDAIKSLVKDICMHVAVMKPLCVEPVQLSQEDIEKEKAAQREQLKESGKPENIIDKIVEGKIGKYYEEVCLLNQKFIKNDKISVSKHIEEISKKASCTVSVVRYAMFSIGK